jgi:hypothetical protein
LSFALTITINTPDGQQKEFTGVDCITLVRTLAPLVDGEWHRSVVPGSGYSMCYSHSIAGQTTRITISHDLTHVQGVHNADTSACLATALTATTFITQSCTPRLASAVYTIW